MKEKFSIHFEKFKFWNVIKHFSSELPTIYIVSWIAIGWLGAWLKYNQKFLTKDFEDIFFVFVGVVLVSEIYIFIKNKYKKKKTVKLEINQNIEKEELTNVK